MFGVSDVDVEPESDIDVEPESATVDVPPETAPQPESVPPETAPEPESTTVNVPPRVRADEPETAECYKSVSTVKFYGGRKSYGQRGERTRKRPARYSD